MKRHLKISLSIIAITGILAWFFVPFHGVRNQSGQNFGAAGVTLGATITTSADLNSRSSWTVSHTVDTGMTLLVVATVQGSSVTGITYNGVAMTQFVAAGNPNYIYYLKNPTEGAHNIVVSMSASNNDHALTAWNFSGNDTTTAMESATDPGLNTDSTTVTTTLDGEYVVSSMRTNSTGSTWTYSTGTKNQDAATTNYKVASGYQAAVTAGSQTVTWSKSAGTSNNIFAAVKAAPASSGSTNPNRAVIIISKVPAKSEDLWTGKA